jgi:Ca-activated chloride channel family protein
MSAILAAGMLLAASWLTLPARVESWLFNPRERTETGREALENGDAETAADALDTAARLAPDDPLAHFNAGTGRLLAERRGAVDELEQAATLAPADLLPRALYNLGNAQLAGGDPAAAVEAFKQSLRLAPDQVDAKHNLELALRALEQQKSGQNEDQETPDSQNPGEQEQSPAEGAEDSPDDNQPQPQGEESSGQENREGQPQPDQTQQDSPLPNFEDQPDMTAEQAAAILEAVENLEREQRQEQALERLKSRKKGDQDW